MIEHAFTNVVTDREGYVCPNHEDTWGWEPCCSCGGWKDGEEKRLCTEEIEYQLKKDVSKEL